MHCDDFANYLNKMATRGWHFEKWEVGLTFVKGEPANTTYAVEVFTEASEDDTRPEKNTKEFAEYCEVAGWKLIDARRKFCIFQKIHDEAVDIATPEERVNNAYKGQMSGAFILLLILYGVNVLMRWATLILSLADTIFSPLQLFTFAFWNIIFFKELYRFIYARRARRRLLKVVAEGKELYIGTGNRSKMNIDINTFFRVLLLVIFVGYLFIYKIWGLLMFLVFAIMLVSGFRVNVGKRRPKSEINRATQIISTVILIVSGICLSIGIVVLNEIQRTHRKLPLYVSDYRENAGSPEDSYGFKDTSFLGSKEYCTISMGADSLYYEVYRTDIDWILDRIWDEQVRKEINEITTDVSDEWGAAEAFHNKAGYYYVRYENAILVFEESKDIILTSKQIDIIREKLSLR